MALPVYSSREVSVAWTGQKLDGLAPDSFVTFSLNADITDQEVGSDGQVNISRSPDNTGTCTLSFQMNSPSNLILSGILAAQRGVTRAFVTGSLTVTDPSGGVLAIMTGCHIMTAPEVSLGITATGGTRDWVFFCEDMTFTSLPEGLAEGTQEAALVAGAVTGILGNI